MSHATAQMPAFDRMDVFVLEWASDPQISPDGQYVVYRRNGMDIMKDRKKGSLWLLDLKAGTHQKLTNREVSESSPRWSPQGDRIAFKSSTDEGSEIYMYWVATGKYARLTQLENSPSGLSWSPSGKQLAFSMKVPERAPMLVKSPKKPKGATWAPAPRVTTRLKHEQDGLGYISPGFYQLFVLPADGGTARQVTKGDFQHRGTPQWTVDEEGLLFSANRNENWEYEFRNSEIYKVSLSDGKVVALTERKGPDRSPVVSPEGEMIAYLGYEDKVQTYQITRIQLMRMDGSRKKELPLKLDRSVSSLTWDAEGKGLYFQYDDEGHTKVGYTDLKGNMREVANDLGGTAIGRPYGGGSYTVSNQGVIVYTHTSPYDPSDLVKVEEGISTFLTQLNQDVLPYRTLGQVEEIWYQSTVDGRRIQGWIVKPPFYDAERKYPLLVENHGGPVSNYGSRFSPEIQLYAAADYVVFYPNPRGSTGYGEEFGNLLYNNYPGDDYQDVMDGVDEMLRRGLVTEDSLFVTGGSAGGIMTAWMIGKNNRFRSAAVVKPVMNWVSKTLTADNYYGYSFYRYPNWPWENIEGYMKFSPISLVGNIETPTLVMVGMEDRRTPISEAAQLYHALKLRKIETALVEIPGASHGIARRPSQLITKVDHVLAWFEKYRESE
ncbi:MAG: S9 family peptidase [Bacteroidota bacterium]